MKRTFAAVLLGSLLVLPCASFAQEEGKKATFWIFGPFSVEGRLQPEGKTWAEVGLGGILVDNDGPGSSTQVKAGLMAGVNFYPAGGGRGFGYGVRIGSADVTYVQPQIVYVTRPNSKNPAFRLGLGFPFGSKDKKKAIPFNFELGVGFQF